MGSDNDSESNGAGELDHQDAAFVLRDLADELQAYCQGEPAFGDPARADALRDAARAAAEVMRVRNRAARGAPPAMAGLARDRQDGDKPTTVADLSRWAAKHSGESLAARLRRAVGCCAYAIRVGQHDGLEAAAAELASRLELADPAFHLASPEDIAQTWAELCEIALAQGDEPMDVLAHLVADTGAYGFVRETGDDANNVPAAREYIRGALKRRRRKA